MLVRDSSLIWTQISVLLWHLLKQIESIIDEPQSIGWRYEVDSEKFFEKLTF